ncbi:MAG: hypothetical protein JNK57_14265 [Planctomycetaceae bacterium]|nr:hypothetical protein [Planctomycetaceae bacterium]
MTGKSPSSRMQSSWRTCRAGSREWGIFFVAARVVAGSACFMGVVVLLVLIGVPCRLAVSQDAQEKSSVAPLPHVSIAQAEEIFEKIGQANDSMITISREDGVLKSGIPLQYQEANNIRNQIGQAIQGYGGHSSVSGNNHYECHLISPNLTGIIQRNESARLMLQELQGQKRRLEVNDSETGLRISIANNEDYFLLFHDRRDQGLIVQESDGDFMFNGQFSDFNDFCLRNSDYCQQRLFPLFRRFGIKFPETAYESSIRQLILDVMVGDPQDVQELLSRVHDQITSPEYQQRQDGFKKLVAEYPSNRVPLVCLILDPEQPADVRHHLLESLATHDKDLHQTLKNIVLPQDLLNNVPFLVWVLKTEEMPSSNDPKVADAVPQPAAGSQETSPPGTTPQVSSVRDPRFPSIVRQRLAQLTQQPADTPLGQWLEMALGRDDQARTTISLEVPVDFFENSDGFSLISGKCQAFVQLVSDGVTLRSDRDHWKGAFNHRTPREHFDETREFAKSRSLPTQWLVEPSGYKLDEDVHALVLFERLRPEIKERPANPNYAYYQSQQAQNPTNACQIDGESLLLSMDMGQSPVKMEESPCRVQFAEHAGKKRAIQIVDRPGKDFSLTLHSEELGVYTRLQVKANGETTLRQFQGSQTFQSLSPTFQQFQADHPAVVDTVLLPAMKLLGAEIRREGAASSAELP